MAEGVTIRDWLGKVGKYAILLFRRWYLLLLGAALGAAVGYFTIKQATPAYSASLTFVLSTESKSGNGGLTSLASQFGLDVGSGASEGIFSGDNIIELFKSRKLITRTLLHRMDGSERCLAEYLAWKRGRPAPVGLSPFPVDPDSLSKAQDNFIRGYIGQLSASFSVFKKDKKLSFYVANASSESDTVPYFIVRYIVDETSRYFIETKTKVARRNLELLQKEADSLNSILGSTFSQTASESDRTYNMNPSLVIQRSGIQHNQARLAAMTAAYTEVMRNLEVAKIGVLRETPLFEIIDLPVFPLSVSGSTSYKPVLFDGIIGFVLMLGLLLLIGTWKDILSIKI